MPWPLAQRYPPAIQLIVRPPVWHGHSRRRGRVGGHKRRLSSTPTMLAASAPGRRKAEPTVTLLFGGPVDSRRGVEERSHDPVCSSAPAAPIAQPLVFVVNPAAKHSDATTAPS
jgi:hypothetical protein